MPSYNFFRLMPFWVNQIFSNKVKKENDSQAVVDLCVVDRFVFGCVLGLVVGGVLGLCEANENNKSSSCSSNETKMITIIVIIIMIKVVTTIISKQLAINHRRRREHRRKVT